MKSLYARMSVEIQNLQLYSIEFALNELYEPEKVHKRAIKMRHPDYEKKLKILELKLKKLDLGVIKGDHIQQIKSFKGFDTIHVKQAQIPAHSINTYDPASSIRDNKIYHL